MATAAMERTESQRLMPVTKNIPTSTCELPVDKIKFYNMTINGSNCKKCVNLSCMSSATAMGLVKVL